MTAVQKQKPNLPVVSYDTISKDYLDRGIDLYDVKKMFGKPKGKGHFEAWHESKGLPEFDTKGVSFESSRKFFALYKEDEMGEKSAPAFVNVWHYLLRLSEDIPWHETSTEKVKRMPVAEAILTIPEELSDEKIQNARKKLEKSGPIPDYAFDQFINRVKMERIEAIESRKIMREILDTYGIDDDEYGKVMIVEMKVDC